MQFDEKSNSCMTVNQNYQSYTHNALSRLTDY